MTHAEYVKPELTGARWSSACRCPRMPSLALQGALAAPTGDRVQRLWQRGHDVAEAYWRDHDYGRVSREHEVTWGKGWTAHCDGVLLDDPARRHVELKSTTRIDTLPGPEVVIDGVTTKASALQVAGHAYWDPWDGDAMVITISPVDYETREYPINVEALAPVADMVEAMVVHAAETGELPPRQCAKPSDGIGRFCGYIQACFADWDEPDPILLDGELARLADELLEADHTLAEAKLAVAEATAERDEARATIRPLLTPGVDHWTDRARVRVSPVKGRTTFHLADALAAGALTPEAAEPFTKTSTESERWTVEQISTESEDDAA